MHVHVHLYTSQNGVFLRSFPQKQYSAYALLGGVVASLLRQNHRTPPLRQSFFRRARGARRDTVWRFSGGLDISQKRTFPIQLRCIFVLITQWCGKNNCLHQAHTYVLRLLFVKYGILFFTRIIRILLVFYSHFTLYTIRILLVFY